MPQMAPISWLSLFIIFSITLIIFNTMNYFSFTTTAPPSNFQTHSTSSSLTWKW